MAAVTLKDLMDPLSKIEAAANQTNEKLDSLIAVSTGSSGGSGMDIMGELQKQTQLLQVIAGISDETERNTGKSLFQTIASGLQIRALVKSLRQNRANKKRGIASGGGDDNAKANASVLTALGIGSIKTAMGMTLWALVPKKGVNKFTEFLDKTFKKLAEVDNKKARKGIENLEMMGGAIFKFAKGLALATPLLLIGMLGIPVLYITSILVAPLFMLLGSQYKRIRRGAKAMDKMGDGLRSFGIGMAIFGLATLFIVMQPKILLGMVASIVLVGGAVALLGGKRMAKRVRRGAGNLSLLGLGVAVFGLGYAVFAASFPKGVGLMDVAVQGAAIIAVGGAAGLLGKFDLKTILKGAAAVAAFGLALIPFVKGYEDYADVTKGMSLKDVLVQGAAILAIGIAIAVVGKFGIMNMAMGALSMALIGAALAIFNFGYVPFAQTTRGMGIEDVGVQLAILAGIGTAMGVAGVAVAASGGTAMLGPALFAAAGGALLALAPGLQAMRDLKYTTEDGIALATTLGAVAMAFAGTATEEGEEGGVWSSIKGAFSRVGESGAGLAAAAMYGAAGLALQSLAKGLTAFKDIKFTKTDSTDLALALGSVSAAFAQAGGEASPPGGLLGDVFGNAFSPNAVENGIDSVMDAGEALTSIAAGLNAFQGLKDPVGLANKIGLVVGSVGKAFASIGGADMEEKDGGSFLGFTWDENVIEKGIESIMDAGEALTGIAEGLNKFQGLVNPKETAGKIKDVLSLVGGAFAAIGGQEEKDGGSFLGFTWDENVIAKGIDAVDGAGKSLTDIATGLNGFANIDATKVSSSIGTFLTSISTTFKELYEKNANISEQLGDFSSFIVTLGDVAKKGYLDKAAEGISKIADSINKIDIDKTIAFGELFRSSAKLQDDDDAYDALAQAVEDIRDILKSGGTAAASNAGGTGGSTGGSSSGGNASLNITLRSLNRAIDSLPRKISTAVSSAEITVQPAP
jgi:hypothetical protein